MTHDRETELAVLGAVMVATSPQLVTALAVDQGLQPDHFAEPVLGRVWGALLELADEGRRIEPVGVKALLEGRDAKVLGEALEKAGLVSEAGAYAATIVRLATARHMGKAAAAIMRAADKGDVDQAAQIAGTLTAAERGPARKSVDTRKADLIDHAERPVTDVLRWPFGELDRLLNGFWPGHLTILGGVTRHGKSVVADQVAEQVVKQGGTACLYLTEMAERERDLRYVARHTGLPFARLLRGDVPAEGLDGYMRAVKELPFEAVRVGAMNTQDVARDIRRRRWTVAVVDLLNGLPGRELHEIESNVTTLAAAAQDSGTHLICCQHLNRNRIQAAYPPEPTLGDIRGSGQVADLATNVLFVYRLAERDGKGVPTHRPGSEAYVEVAKAKNGLEGRVELHWHGSRMRFVLPDPVGTVGSVAA